MCSAERPLGCTTTAGANQLERSVIAQDDTLLLPTQGGYHTHKFISADDNETSFGFHFFTPNFARAKSAKLRPLSPSSGHAHRGSSTRRGTKGGKHRPGRV